MAERPAVNRKVVGSMPTLGAIWLSSSMVEPAAHNRFDPGSSPGTITTNRRYGNPHIVARVAELVDALHLKCGSVGRSHRSIAGSTPALRTIVDPSREMEG